MPIIDRLGFFKYGPRALQALCSALKGFCQVTNLKLLFTFGIRGTLNNFSNFLPLCEISLAF